MRAPVSSYVPQFSPSDDAGRKPFAAWGVVFGVALAVLGLTLLAPLSLANDYGFLASILYQGFRAVCHQMPERSFHLEGHPLAVCARCFGVYAGFVAGTLVYPLVRSLKRRDTPRRMWLILSVLPTATDFMLGFLGIWENTCFSRATTGALLGAVSAFYVVPGMVELSQGNWRGYFRGPSKRVMNT